MNCRLNVVRSILEKKAEEAAAAIIVAAIGDSNCPARGKVGKPRQSHTYIVMDLINRNPTQKKSYFQVTVDWGTQNQS